MANRYSIETIFKAIDKISAPVSRMQKRIRDFTDSAANGLNKASSVTLLWSKGLAAVGSAVVGSMVTAAGGIALFVTETNKANAEITNMSKAMGISADMTRAMDGVLSNSTMNWENFTDQIEEMRNKFGEMKGAGEMKKLTEALGIANLKWKDLKGLSPEKQYIKIMDALVNMKDAQKAAFVADEIFGGEGNKITGLLRARGQTMTEVIKEYQKFNFFTKEGQKASEDFNKAISPLGQISQSIKSEIAGLLGGAMIPYIESAKEWAASNKELIKADISRLVANLTKLFEQLVPKLAAGESWIGKIADAVGWLAANTEGIKTWTKYIFMALGVFLSLTVILKTLALVMAVVNLVMAANPIVLITILVVALIAVVAYLIDRFVGWGNALKIVGAAILLAMGPIGWLIGAAILIYKNWDMLSGFFKNLWSGIVGVFQGAYNMISGYIDGLINKVTGLISMATSLPGKIGNFFKGGSAEAAGSAVSSPQQRTANQISESRNTSEVTIKDETGRAKMTKGKPGRGVLLQHSGAV